VVRSVTFAVTPSPGTTPVSGTLRVLVADDDPLVRRALRHALTAQPGLVVAGEARDGNEAVQMALGELPDIVLMDIDMPTLDGVTATSRIRRAAPQVEVVILSTASDDDLGLLGLRAGAAGFLAKDVPIEALARALHGVKRGEAAISRALALKLVDRLRRAPERAHGMRPVHSSLTSREWQVLDLLCAGHTTDAIAAELFVSTETVRSHVKHILGKLGAHSRAEAVEMATRMRQDDPDDAGEETVGTLDELASRRVLHRLQGRDSS
jgi:NarL family two-component system response regulator LiaR